MERISQSISSGTAALNTAAATYLPLLVSIFLLTLCLMVAMGLSFHFHYLRKPKFLTRWEVLVKKIRARREEVDQLMTDLYSDLLDEAHLAGLLTKRERNREAKKLARVRRLPDLIPLLSEELKLRQTKNVIKKRLLTDANRGTPVPLPDANHPRTHTLRTVIERNKKPTVAK